MATGSAAAKEGWAERRRVEHNGKQRFFIGCGRLGGWIRIAWCDSKGALGAEVSQGGGVGRAAAKHFLELIAGLAGAAEFGERHREVDAGFDQVRFQADSVPK